ncbi:MAG: DUF2723 domain-containing protein [Calditrichaeota bacterium]|nr:DUF2723 domain-containing protein [Calditrichota bacterium]RQV99584.1 MAG: DUF2723 domain-containing protein [Calditrichota bacterium]
MENGKLNKLTAAFVFFFSFIVYFLTISPTVSFWDCGEFIACSYRLAVPHPPGAPLYLLVGRIFSMLPIFSDIAMRVNFISTLSSAFTVMFLYLTIVMFVRHYTREKPEGFQRFVPIIGGVIGSLTFAFTTSFWFNAVEAEVYAVSMLFTSMVVWMIMYWNERSDEYRNERFLLVIMYLVGLAIGVHLLNVLALPMVFMIIYYKKYPLNITSFAFLIIVGAVLMGMIYPGLVQGIPELAQHFGFTGLIVGILVLIFLLNYVLKQHKELASLLLMSVLLVILGYSTYTTIYIRSNLNPNIDENNPETIEKFVSYMNREQYGEHTLDRGKVLAESPHGRKYSSEWDFFWNYQVQKMYTRYFLWNFMGKDPGSENFSWTRFLGIPLLLGLIGAWYHFVRDWKYALAVFVLFFMTGLAIVLYLNQPDPQPRERDYSYVGSFFAFAIWIGIGAAAIVDYLSRISEKSAVSQLMPISITALIFIAAPVQVLMSNYDEHDRSGNYVAWDYSYNMLVTCNQDGIIYTNGDNDTFPLWYLQEVEYIRTDVRVANLSLLNTNWYIEQLKHHEPTVPISLSQREIDNVAPVPWPQKRTIEIEIPEDYLQKEVLQYRSSMQVDNPNISSKMTFSLGPKFYNRYLRVQDYMILNTLYANRFRKPLYFAVTVSRDNMLDDLQKYLRMDGLAFKITAIPQWQIDPDTLYENLMNKYIYRNLNDPDVYYNEDIIALLQNYRSAFIQLCNHYVSFGEKEKIRELMEKARDVMPASVIPYTNQMLKSWMESYEIYSGLIELDSLNLRNYTRDELENMGKILFNLEYFEASEKAFTEIIRNYPDDHTARAFLVDVYARQEKYDKSIEILEEWLQKNPGDQLARQRLQEYHKKVAADATKP